MPTSINMPKLGMTMTEGTVVDWPIALGEHVEKGDIVLAIESEKAEVEIEATATGFFRHIYVEAGETVPCTTLLGALTDTEDEPFDAEAFFTEQGGANVVQPSVGEASSVVAAPLSRGSGNGARRAVAPAARGLAKKLAAAAGMDPDELLANVSGTGPGGRVVRADIEAWAARREALVSVADGVALEVLSSGEGAPVLMLPGFGTDAAAFARQTPVLAERYRVQMMNPRGVGLSDAPDTERYDLSVTASDAAGLLDGPTHVIGVSMGAAVAVELALTNPELVRSLTLLTPAVEVGPRLTAVLSMWCRLAAEAGPEPLAAALMPWLFSDAVLGDERARARTERGLADIVRRVRPEALARHAAGLLAAATAPLERLAALAVPTLVVGAGADLLTPHAERVAAAIEGASLTIVEGAGHAVGLEAPEAVNAAILGHLDALT